MIDELKLQHGEGYDYFGLTFHHPKLKDIVELKNGYSDYAFWVSLITNESIDLADILWVDGGIWYEDIESEWVFFLEKAVSNSVEQIVDFNVDGEHINAKCLLIDENLRNCLNFFLGLDGEYAIVVKNEEQIVLYNCTEQNGLLSCTDESPKFTEAHYYELKSFLKTINWVYSDEVEQLSQCGNRRAKEFLLKQQYKKRKRQSGSNVNFCSIISSLIGSSIRYEDVWNLPIYVVYDVYYRKVKINEYNHTTQAYYAGSIDTKKSPINWEKINWCSIIRKYDKK